MKAPPLLVYFGVSLALAIAPGPDIFFVLSQALTQGALAGIIVSAGLCTGLLFHVALAAMGIAALLSKRPAAFRAVTCIGASYLLWIAWLTWQSSSPQIEGADATLLPPLHLYLRGVVMNICNPKVMLFFLAFVPRFTKPERGGMLWQFLGLGALFALAVMMVFGVVCATGGTISAFFRNSPAATLWLNRAAALVLVAIALWIFRQTLKSPQKNTAVSSAQE